MTEISLLEYVVLAVVAYSGIIILAASAIKDAPATKNLSIARIIFIMPSMICNAALMGSGPKIVMPMAYSNSTTLAYNITTNAVISKFQENVTSGGFNMVMGPTWNLVHFSLFIIIMVFLAFQILAFMTKTD